MTAAEREERILSLARLVHKVARYKKANLPSQVAFDDLLSAGWVGAIEAVDHFEPARNVPLESYAYWRICGSITDYLRSLDPVSRDDRNKLNANPNARAPRTISIHAMPEGHVFDISDSRSLTAVRCLEARLDVATLCKATRGEIQPRALRMVKSWARGETMKAIGRREGCNESRVSQICKRTHLKLRMAA